MILPFLGLSKNVDLDERGARIPHYEIVNIQDGKMKVIIDEVDVQNLNAVILPTTGYIFPGRATVAPPDIPKCGFFNEKCPSKYGFTPFFLGRSIFARV